MTRCVPLLMLAAAACGWSEDKFWAEGLPAWCEEAAACEGFSVDACIDHVRATDLDGCDFDGAAARECANSLEDGQCQDNGDLGTQVYQSPEACDLVFADCGAFFQHPISVGTSPVDETR